MDIKKRPPKNRPLPEVLPDTPTAKILQEIGVRPSVVRELCHEDFDYVKEIIVQGRLSAHVRSLAAWTVSALRDSRDHGWQTARRMEPKMATSILKNTPVENMPSGLILRPAHRSPRRPSR